MTSTTPVVLNPRLAKISGATLGLVNAVLLAVYAVADLDISDVEKGVVSLVASTTVAFGFALYGHFRAGTPDELVAVFAATVAFTESVLGALVVFSAWGLSADKAVFLQGVVLATLALVGAFLLRDRVYAASTVADAAAMAKLDPHTDDPNQPS